MKSIKYVLLLLIGALVLSGCSLLGGEKENIDPPQEVSYEEELDLKNEEEAAKDAGEEGTESVVQTELYLIDKNGLVAPVTIALPNTESVAKQALEYLVVGGPVTDLLPNDFRAVIPASTELSVNIVDNVATVNFSNEFADYAPEDEKKILQSVTWTLTQFDSIEKVNLQINGHDLTEMPVAGTPINGDLTRNIGINLDTTGVTDITNTYPVTVYYIAQTDENSYYVPVTKRVSKKEGNKVATIVNELIKGPSLSSPLYSLLMNDVKLVQEPKVKDGVVTLDFNENIYGSFEQKLVTDQVLHQLVLSLTEQEGIEGVAISVNGENDIVNQDGESMSEPVNRPQQVNTFGF